MEVLFKTFPQGNENFLNNNIAKEIKFNHRKENSLKNNVTKVKKRIINSIYTTKFCKRNQLEIEIDNNKLIKEDIKDKNSYDIFRSIIRFKKGSISSIYHSSNQSLNIEKKFIKIEKKPKFKTMVRVVGYKNKPISHIPEQKNLLHSGKPKKKRNVQIHKFKSHRYIKSNRTLNLLPIKEIQFSIPEKNFYKINKIISFNIIKNEKEKEKYKIF